jgi:alpha-D-xyloside xylohydrolase
MRIEFCGDDVVHVVASRTTDIPAAKVPVAVHQCQANAFQKDSGREEIKLSNSAITVRVNLASGAISFLSKDGKAVLSEPPAGGKSFEVPSVWETKEWQVQQTFLSPSDESLYGLGQHQEGVWDLRRVPLRLHQSNTNISIPFLLSSKGYGILWNNPSLTDFDPADQVIQINPENGKGKFKTGAKGSYGFLVSSDNRNRLTVEVDGRQVVNLQNMWTPTSASGVIELQGNEEHEISARGGPAGVELTVRPPQDTTTFRSEVGQAIDYYFFYGPALNRVISEYRELTGAAPLFPKWAYGYWQCRERYHNQKEILDTAVQFRTRKIPVDALVQDWQYWGKYGWNAMKFDEDSYPHPKQLIDELHAKDLHMMISVWSRFGEDTDVYKRMQARSLLIPGTPWMDFFNPEARKAFWAELDKELFKDGMDSWWMDASEPEFDVLKGKQTFLGSGESVRNAYPLYVTQAIYEGQRATTDRKRVVILTRSAFAGQQRNAAASWSGDITGNWITLRRQISAGLSFSMSGLPYWTTDFGGFFRPDDQYTSEKYHELLVRWYEYGAFCPIFRVHGYKSNAEPWNYGPEVERIFVKYDDLRYRLLPYIYSAAWGVTQKGETLMTALPLEFAADRGSRIISDQFLFGSALMVAPVATEGATQREVWLPGGTDWIDFWTGQRAKGGQTVIAQAPLETIPIYVKAGSIVPFGPSVESAGVKSDPIDVRVYDGADADFTLYEDEGDNYDYERGARSVIAMHWNNKTETLTIGDRQGSFPGMLEHRAFRVVRVATSRSVGSAPAQSFDATVSYEGKGVSIRLHPGGEKR